MCPVSLRQQRPIGLGKDVWIKLEKEFHMNPVIQMVILSCVIFFSFTRIANLQHEKKGLVSLSGWVVLEQH